MKVNLFAKRLLKSPPVIRLLSHLAAGYVRLVLATARLERHIAPEAVPYASGERQGVFAFWHSRLLLLPCFTPPGRSMDVLISHHRDGRMISDIIARFGVGTVSGSSSKGGAQAMRELLRVLARGGNISITPDGPRGPARQAAAGAAQLAAKMQLPVVPVAYASVRHHTLNSWDRFHVALPFSRVMLVIGAPVFPPPKQEAGFAEFRAAVEAALNAVTDEADRQAGLALEHSSVSR